MADFKKLASETRTDSLQSVLKAMIAGSLVQLRNLIPLFLVVYIPILLGLAGLVGAYLIADIPMRIFFIDPVAEFNSPMYVGLVSNIGVLLWGGAASTCLFGGWLTFNNEEYRERSWFLILFGLFTALLMLDDLFLLHEEVFEDHLFINQKYVFLAYGMILLSILYRFQKTILRSDYMLLLFSFVFFAISVGVDLLIEPEEFTIFGVFPGRHIIEDGVKLLGIASWAAYFVRTSAQLVAPLIRHD